MCGLAGLLAETGDAPDLDALRLMCARLVHRGPDAQGEYADESVALGHRRLSIIDLAGGNQPLGNENGTVQVVLNGEIYNYRDLRREMAGRGHRFRTASDTEVLVHLYEEEGERLPERLDGMFAFALWDARRRTLLLGRDRLGKKPLYYGFSLGGARLAFASELKALAALPGFAGRIEARSLADFLALSYVPDPATIYEGVFKLPPAHILKVTPRGHWLRRYWKPEFGEWRQGRLEEAVEELRALAAGAVGRRLVSDVPLGAFLSGGLDSSAVVGFMAARVPGRVRTFSIGFTDKRIDELPYARAVARHHGAEHSEEVVTPSIAETLETLVWHFDEPFGDASAIPTLYLARMARRQVTVALCGDGADEVFAGYRRYRFGVFEAELRRRLPDWFRRSVVAAAGRCYPKLDFLPRVVRAKTLLTNLAREAGDAYFTSMSALRDGALAAVLSEQARKSLNGYDPRLGFRERFSPLRDLSPLEQMQQVDLDTYLPGDILVKADRASMAYSLETRSPWLDWRLVEFGCRLPPWFKLRNGTGKEIFRRMAAPELPAAVLRRKKMGFVAPLASWLRTSLRQPFQEMVFSGAMQQYLDLRQVRRLWKAHQAGYRDRSRELWNLFVLAAWHARHRRGQSLAGLAG